MKKEDLAKAKVGDFAQAYMNRLGEINNSEGDFYQNFHMREFEILAVASSDSEHSYVLCLYNDEKLHECDLINDIHYYLDKHLISKSKIIDEYKNKYGRWLNNPRVYSIKASGPDGCFCKVCKEFYNMAVPNQSDNTLLCWSCRQNPMRAYY